MSAPNGQQQQPPQQQLGTVSLKQIVDVMVQKAYHELSILSEICPRQNDAAKKYALMKYIRDTRTRFLRLLVIVKWAASSSQVASAWAVAQSLDQQSGVFKVVADDLDGQLRRLQHCSLPLYSIPNAVDVLSTGQFARLPTSIGEIAQKTTLSATQVNQTLDWLEHQLLVRLPDLDLPTHLTSIRIAQGRLWLKAEHLYELSLTLGGPEDSAPWRLLSVDILVENPTLMSTHAESADKRLVTLRHIESIHRMVVGQLNAPHAENPLKCACYMLWSVCLSLLLDVLCDQADKICRGEYGRGSISMNVRDGQELTLSFWKNQGKLHTLSIGLETDNAIELCTDKDQIVHPMKIVVTNQPALLDPTTGTPTNLAIDVNEPQLTSLLLHSQRLIAYSLLQDVLRHCEGLNIPDTHLTLPTFEVSRVPVLQILYDGSVVARDSGKEKPVIVTIRVCDMTGRYLVAPQVCGDDMDEFIEIDVLEGIINVDLKLVPKAIKEFRSGLVVRSLKKMALSLDLIPHQSVPLLGSDGSLVNRDPNILLYCHISRHRDYYLTVAQQDEVLSFELIRVESHSAMRPVVQQRQLLMDLNDGGESILTFEAAVKVCRRVIPQRLLYLQLHKHNIPHSFLPATQLQIGRSVEGYLYNVCLPKEWHAPGEPTQHSVSILQICAQDSGCEITIPLSPEKLAIMVTAPNPKSHSRCVVDKDNKALRYRHNLVHGCIDQFIRDLEVISKLLALMYTIQQDNDKEPQDNKFATVEFSLLAITITYGQIHKLTVTFVSERGFKLNFSSSHIEGNPHDMIARFLEKNLNDKKCMKYLLSVLEETFAAMASIKNVVRVPAQLVAPGISLPDVCYVARSVRSGRLLLLQHYALDFWFTESEVRIRDGCQFQDNNTFLKPFPEFQDFFAKLQPIGESSTQECAISMDMFKSITNAEQHQTCSLYRYVGLVDVIKTVNTIISAGSENGDSVSSLSAKAGQFMIRAQRTLSLAINSMQQPDITLSSHENPFISAEEINILCQFFVTRIAVAPFREKSVKTFISILHLPKVTLSDVVQVLTMDLDPAIPIRLRTFVPNQFPQKGVDAFVINKAEAKINLMVQVPSATNKAIPVDLPLTIEFDSARNISTISSWFPQTLSEAENNRIMHFIVNPDTQRPSGPLLAWFIKQLLTTNI